MSEAGTDCAKCGYPPREAPAFRVRLIPDAETSAVMESARRAAKEVAQWPSWKAGYCTCVAVSEDPRKTALKDGLRQLRPYEIRRLIDHAERGGVLLDRDDYGRANFSSGMYCPLAVATDCWNATLATSDDRVAQFLTEGCGFRIYNTRGVVGEFYTTNRREDLLLAAREVLAEKTQS